MIKIKKLRNILLILLLTFVLFGNTNAATYNGYIYLPGNNNHVGNFASFNLSKINTGARATMRNYGNGSGYSRMKAYNSSGWVSSWSNLYNNGTEIINIPTPISAYKTYHLQIGEGDL